MTEISRGDALMTDGSAAPLGDGWGGEDGLSAPVQQRLWDSGGFLPTKELPWGLASGCNVDQVGSDDGEGGKFRGGAVWPVAYVALTQGFYMELLS